MATEGPFALRDGTRVAGADLSTHQYKFIKLDSAGAVVICAAASDRPYGVLQNAPASGEEADVLLVGFSKVSADAALAIGIEIGTSADGQADAKVRGTDLAEYIAGQVIEASGAAAEIIRCSINTVAMPTAAAVA